MTCLITLRFLYLFGFFEEFIFARERVETEREVFEYPGFGLGVGLGFKGRPYINRSSL